MGPRLRTTERPRDPAASGPNLATFPGPGMKRAASRIVTALRTNDAVDALALKSGKPAPAGIPASDVLIAGDV